MSQEQLKTTYIDISDNFEIGWNIFLEQKNNLLWLLLGLNLPVAIVEQFVPDPNPETGVSSPIIIPFLIIANIIGILINLAIHIITERSIYRESVNSTLALQKASSKLLITFVIGFLFIIITFLGGLLFLIPGIYLAIIFGFFTEAIALRNCNFDAFTYSRNLVKGQFWKVFGRLFLLGISFFALLLFFMIPMSLISIFLAELPLMQGLIEVILSLAIAIVSYFFAITFTVYFLNLDYLKNGLPQRA